MAIENKTTLFLDGPDNFPAGLQDNEDYKKFGYGYYLGAPWSVGQINGKPQWLIKMQTEFQGEGIHLNYLFSIYFQLPHNAIVEFSIVVFKVWALSSAPCLLLY